MLATSQAEHIGRRAAECSACRADLSGHDLPARVKQIFACRTQLALQQRAVAAQQVAVAAQQEPVAEEAGQPQPPGIVSTAGSFAPCQLPALPMRPTTPLQPPTLMQSGVQPQTPMPPPLAQPVRTPGQTPSAARTELPPPSASTLHAPSHLFIT